MADNWTLKQREAIDANGCNVLVAAAAGSGKTAVLVERIIRKITDGAHPVDIDRLVVVTFTKAAAAEMKQRIRMAIDSLLRQNPDSERLQRQLTLINNAQITTIDSFCLNIVRSYFTELDIDPGFRTADEGEIKLLENDVMEAMLEDYYASDNSAFYDFVDAYGTGRDDSGIVALILKIYRFARSYPWEQEWYEACRKLYQVNRAADLDENEAVRYLWTEVRRRLFDYDRLYDRLEEMCVCPGGPVMYLPAILSDHAGIRRMLEAQNYSSLVRAVQLVSFDTLGRSRNKELSEEMKEAVKTARNGYKDFINKTLKTRIFAGSAEKQAQDIADNAASIEMMMQLSAEFSVRMQAEKRSRNIIDFNDMEHMALNVLVHRENGESVYTEASEVLGAFYEEILIDEYQDSNMLQEAILTAVSRGRRDPEQNNVYMVGDVKQSIYKFRLACPELFIEKYNTYSEGGNAVRIELQTNFRSRSNVLSSVNDVFYRLMNPGFCGIIYDEKAQLNPGFAYPPCPEAVLSGQAWYKAEDFGKNKDTEIYLIDTQQMKSDSAEDGQGGDAELSSREQEAEAVAQIVRGLMETSSDGSVITVYDKNTAEGYRKIRYSDIVVLTRTVTGWADTFVNALMRYDIPAYADSAEGYFNVREIQLILSYLAVIDNPLQDIPMAAVLLSYFGRLNTEELTRIRAGDKKTCLYGQLKTWAEAPDLPGTSENSGISQKIQIFLGRLEEYRDMAERMAVHDLLWKVIYDTGYYDYVGTMPAGERRQANLDILLERAGAFEQTSYKGLFNFLRYIERMQKFDVDFGEASVLGENEDLVRVMSIHKSKGLEFPVVILAGLGKKMNQRDAAGEVVIDQQLGVGTNVVRLEKRTKNPTLIKAAVSQKRMRDSISEEMRILYVAMTRAREKLIMTGTVKKAEQMLAQWQEKAAVILSQGQYSYSDCAALGTYFDMIMPSACMPPEENNGCFAVKVYGEQKTPSSPLSAEESSGTADAVVADAPAVVLPPYPYPLETAEKTKITVSELKKMQQDDDFDQNQMVLPGFKVHPAEEEAVVPKFISGAKAALPGNERGVAYHRVMECLNYEALPEAADRLTTQIKEQIAGMVQSDRLTEAQAKCVAVQDIAAFCCSATGQRVRRAALMGQVRREQPFVFMEEQTGNQLIQGIIDLYLAEEDGTVIIDYKTDRVAQGTAGEEILKKRYAVQLDYYAKALSQLTGRPVKERIIYSFELGREIHV